MKPSLYPIIGMLAFNTHKPLESLGAALDWSKAKTINGHIPSTYSQKKRRFYK